MGKYNKVSFKIFLVWIVMGWFSMGFSQTCRTQDHDVDFMEFIFDRYHHNQDGIFIQVIANKASLDSDPPLNLDATLENVQRHFGSPTLVPLNIVKNIEVFSGNASPFSNVNLKGTINAMEISENSRENFQRRVFRSPNLEDVITILFDRLPGEPGICGFTHFNTLSMAPFILINATPNCVDEDGTWTNELVHQLGHFFGLKHDGIQFDDQEDNIMSNISGESRKSFSQEQLELVLDTKNRILRNDYTEISSKIVDDKPIVIFSPNPSHAGEEVTIKVTETYDDIKYIITDNTGRAMENVAIVKGKGPSYVSEIEIKFTPNRSGIYYFSMEKGVYSEHFDEFVDINYDEKNTRYNYKLVVVD